MRPERGRRSISMASFTTTCLYVRAAASHPQARRSSISTRARNVSSTPKPDVWTRRTSTLREAMEVTFVRRSRSRPTVSRAILRAWRSIQCCASTAVRTASATTSSRWTTNFSPRAVSIRKARFTNSCSVARARRSSPMPRMRWKRRRGNLKGTPICRRSSLG